MHELLTRDHFEPFRIRLTSGDACNVRDPQTAALMKTRLFLPLPGGDGWVFIQLSHISAVETLADGHPRGPRRRRS